MKILAFTITRSKLGDKRWELWERTFKEGCEKAGYEFDWQLYTNADVNRGQHVVFNEALDKAVKDNYDELARIDDDIEFLSQRWLAKMVEARQVLGPQFILSPTVKGLKYPPPMSQTIDVKGIPCRFLTDAIGGACRMHNVKLLTEAPTPYVSDVRLPLGFGDATGIMKWAKEMMQVNYQVFAVWLEHIRVKHGTAKQEEDDPQYHQDHFVLQKVPYMPAWPVGYAREGV